MGNPESLKQLEAAIEKSIEISKSVNLIKMEKLAHTVNLNVCELLQELDHLMDHINPQKSIDRLNQALIKTIPDSFNNDMHEMKSVISQSILPNSIDTEIQKQIKDVRTYLENTADERSQEIFRLKQSNEGLFQLLGRAVYWETDNGLRHLGIQNFAQRLKASGIRNYASISETIHAGEFDVPIAALGLKLLLAEQQIHFTRRNQHSLHEWLKRHGFSSSQPSSTQLPKRVKSFIDDMFRCTHDTIVSEHANLSGTSNGLPGKSGTGDMMACARDTLLSADFLKKAENLAKTARIDSLMSAHFIKDRKESLAHMRSKLFLLEELGEVHTEGLAFPEKPNSPKVTPTCGVKDRCLPAYPTSTGDLKDVFNSVIEMSKHNKQSSGFGYFLRQTADTLNHDEFLQRAVDKMTPMQKAKLEALIRLWNILLEKASDKDPNAFQAMLLDDQVVYAIAGRSKSCKYATFEEILACV